MKLKVPPLPRLRGVFAQLIELAAFGAITYGVYRTAGIGVAAIVGGVFGVLVAFEVDRP